MGRLSQGLARVAVSLDMLRKLKRKYGKQGGGGKRPRLVLPTSTNKGTRGPGSRTKPKRKKRNKKYKKITQHNDPASKSNVQVNYKPQKIYGIYKKLTGNLQYTGNYSSQLMTSNAQNLNRQYSKVLGTVFTGANYDSVLQAYYNNLPVTDPHYQKYPTVLKGDVGIKPLFKSCFQKYELLNQTEATCHADIYTFMCNNSQDDYEDVPSAWANAIQYDKGSVAGVTPTVNFPGATPVSHKYFNRKWKMIQKTSVELLPGVVHTHFFRFAPKRIIDYDYSCEFRMIKGITYTTFMILRGTPIDNTKGVQGVQTVSYSPVKVDYVVTEHYNWGLLNVMPANHYYTNVMGSLTYDESVVGALFQQNQSGGAGPVNLNDETLMG